MIRFSTSGWKSVHRTPNLFCLVAAGKRVASARFLSDSIDSNVPEPSTQTSNVKTEAVKLKKPIPTGSAKSLKTKSKFGRTRPAVFEYSKAVLSAMRSRNPIVALESAIYTHGFPKPENLKLAQEVEETVLANGAVPATIAILNGKIKIGLEKEELVELAESARSEKTAKISRRDIVYRIAQLGEPLNGGTTIAGTMALADLAGISVFATGGLGGVHRGGENSLDISADLMEFSRSRVAVICSGMKSFLDIARTLEVLETQGVFVGTFGQRGEKVDVPGFWARESGFPSPNVVDSPEEAASILFNYNQLKMVGSPLFFNPIPKEFEIPMDEMSPIIASAVEKSSSIIGKDNTPAVLDEIYKQTAGRSISANWQLVLNNAKMGAQVAVELQKLEKNLLNLKKEEMEYMIAKTEASQKNKSEIQDIEEKRSLERPQSSNAEFNSYGGAKDSDQNRVEAGQRVFDGRRSYSTTARTTEPKDTRNSPTEDGNTSNPFKIVVIGGVVVDRIGKVHAEKSQKFVSNPGTIKTSVGGVAKNLAVTMQNLVIDSDVKLVSRVGADSDGAWAIDQLRDLGLNVDDIQKGPGYTTASYMAINSDQVEGGLSLAVADMEVLKAIEPSQATEAIKKYKPRIVCFDGNLSGPTILAVCKAAKSVGALVACEPTSAPKSADIAKLLPTLMFSPGNQIDLISPNEYELDAIYQVCSKFSEDEELREDLPWQSYSMIVKRNQGEIDKFFNYISNLNHDSTVKAGTKFPTAEQLQSLLTKSITIHPYIPNILIKLGDRGVLMIRHLIYEPQGSLYDPQCSYTPETSYLFIPTVRINFFLSGAIHISYHAAHKVPGTIVNTNGAGDTFFGTFVAGVLHDYEVSQREDLEHAPWELFYGAKLDELIENGQRAAAECLTREESHGLGDLGRRGLLPES